MRLKIPAKEELPGPDTQRFAGLDDYVGLLQRCWAQDPAERPTFEDCIHELRWAGLWCGDACVWCAG